VVRAHEAEDFLMGKELSEAVITQAAALAKKAACPIDDIRGSAEYRKEMAAVLVRKMLHRVWNHAQEETLG
jgi:carbon-monoxide dehydrogenase medium subunit